MDPNKIKLLKQLEEIVGSKFEKVYEGSKEAFAYYFSKFDIEGINNLLIDKNYDGVSKEYYLRLIKKTFNYLKSKDITSLEVVAGTCNGCIKDCEGFTFIDKKSGLYIDIIIEVKYKEIYNFMECYDLNNAIASLNKKERIVVKHFNKY
jgi:hypothetical protein